MELLKSDKRYGSEAVFDVRVINVSRQYIRSMSLEIELYDSANKYLGQSDVLIIGLAPGVSRIEEFHFDDVRLSKVSRWIAKITDVSADGDYEGPGQFALRIRSTGHDSDTANTTPEPVPASAYSPPSIGMTVEQVNKVMASPGEKRGAGETADGARTSYGWKLKDGTTVVGVFLDDELVEWKDSVKRP